MLQNMVDSLSLLITELRFYIGETCKSMAGM